ncbi:unnamed protein product [Paramecium sonneborni]|uniref:Uncharacterized protein n=1 Tax=Paramecium sonneborni TaxID=65129 RepID=A0A8S1P4N6_9CILI|nr:unnamed protein product [Paramecium sonneborni]
MNQQEQVSFKTFQLLQLQNLDNQQYLSGDLQIKQNFILKDEEISLFTLQNNINDPNTHFVLELQDEFRNQYLYYGDLIAIKHFKSQLYVNINHSQKPDEFQSVDAYLGEKPEYFVIQPKDEGNSTLLKYLNQKITHPFRLFSTDNRNYLISQQQKKKNKYLVKGRKNQNDINLNIGVWRFIFVEQQNNILKMFDNVSNEPIFIESGKKVIIRNWLTGFTLHSHPIITKTANKQEVTVVSHPRDENDYWCIVKQNSRNTSKFINYDDQIFLQHLNTARYLNGTDQQSYSKQGNLVCCTDQVHLFYTQAIDDFILEMYKPFTIKFNNQFLAQSKSKAECNIGQQQECICVENQTQTCLWVIEQMI